MKKNSGFGSISQRFSYSLVILFGLMILLLVWTMSGAVNQKTQAPMPIGFAQAKDRLIMTR